MDRHEIRAELALSAEEQSALEYHSFVNLLNVLSGELQLSQVAYDSPRAVETILERFRVLQRGFSTAVPPATVLAEMTAARNQVRGLLEGAAPGTPELREHRLRMMRLLDVADLRVRERLSQLGCPDCWARVEEFVIRHSFEMVFEVMEEVSTRGYRIRFNEPVGEPDRRTYYVVLEVVSPDERTVLVPPGYLDSLRDLAANARKYSEPGTVIRCRITEREQTLHLEVRDQGRGIPQAELEHVIEFGYRASNTEPGETNGGGFGLTRAYALAKRWGGRMWIASSIATHEHGTLVELELPLPGSRRDG